jgi:tartrate dehydrogenase/decarboxylase/D-malate dehydrogenase
MEAVSLKLIPGDGIGVDVVEEAQKVLHTLASLHGGVKFAMDTLPWSCEYYLKHGTMMPEDGMKILQDCDSILLGAVGFPGVPDHTSLQGLLLPIRQQFEQYINMRPIKLLEGLDSPVKVNSPSDIDFVVVRENSEGEYCGKGRIENESNTDETVIQEAWFTRKATERVIRYAFEYAKEHGLNDVTGATKSNALNYSMVFWDKVFNEVKKNYSDITSRLIHVDALAGFFIMKPQALQVVVASNLFGDILTDLGSAMLGSIGISPSANINPEKKYPSMFEPIHGSAPDIAGKGIANPIGTIWSVVMMLDHLGQKEMSEKLMNAMCAVIAERKIRTPDIGGSSTTTEVVDAIIARLTD